MESRSFILLPRESPPHLLLVKFKSKRVCATHFSEESYKEDLQNSFEIGDEIFAEKSEKFDKNEVKIKREKQSRKSSFSVEIDQANYPGTAGLKNIEVSSESIELSSDELLDQPKYDPMDLADKRIKFCPIDEQ